MGKALDPAIAEILKGFGFGREAVWDCHGVIVVYHRIIEQIAAKAGIRFDAPIVLEASGPAKSAALCVTGYLGDKSEWSIGEASPANNKNAYPFAMAEKRAKDRVVLKLVGLHGLAYSEEEADDFKTDEPRRQSIGERAAPKGPAPKHEPEVQRATSSLDMIEATLIKAIDSAKTLHDLQEWWRVRDNKAAKASLSEEAQERVARHYVGHKKYLTELALPVTP